jgi:hypothetical protein
MWRTIWIPPVALLGVLLAPLPVLAQMMGGQWENCPMGAGMWLTAILGVLLVIAAIVVLGALAVFLIRRSGPPRGPREA